MGDDSADAASGDSPNRRRSAPFRAAVLLVAVVLASSVFVRSGVVSLPVIGALVAAFVVGAAILSHSSTDESSDADGDGSVWDAIPSRQYDGRHVESGGLTRGEQEEALEEVQRQADDLEDRP